MVFPEGWTKYKLFSVKNSGASALTNYQVKLTVKRSTGTDLGSTVFVGTDCEEDYDDLRFTKADGTTLLDYWIETASSSEAMVWVELDSLPAGKTTDFKIFYGNSEAAAASDGDATFPLFDDFPGNSIDGDKWTATAGVAVSGSICTITSTSGTSYNITSKSVFGLGYAVRARWKMSTEMNYIAHGFYASANDRAQFYYSTSKSYLTTKNGGITTTAHSNAYTSYANWEARRISSSLVEYAFNDGTPVAVTTNVPIIDLAVAFRVVYHTANVDSSIDWVLVRKVAATEPVIVAWEKIVDEYVYRTFSESGAFNVPTGKTAVDVLLVAGGGGGGSRRVAAAGGGAGGLEVFSAVAVTPEAEIAVVVGAGGAGGGNGAAEKGTTGSDTTFGTGESQKVAKGGGGGGYYGGIDANVLGATGGSGGGGGVDTDGSGGSGANPIGSQGNAGGNGYYHATIGNCAGGGGGGAGAAGGNASSQTAGTGGAGITVWGTTYAAGGAGGQSNTGNGANGAANTGKGGGGAGGSDTATNTGGNGGSGIVVIRWLSEIRVIVSDTAYLYFPAETGGVGAKVTVADTGYVRHSAETSALEAAITGTDIAYLYFLLEYGTLKFLKFAEDIGYLYAIEWTATIRNLVTGSDIGYLYFSTEDSPAPVVHVTAADTGYIRFTEIASLAAAISAADTLYLNPDIETLDIIALLYAEDTLYLAPDVESSIVHNVFNICNESRRRISARVEITYTDPFSEEGVITVTAPDFSYPSHSDDIVDGKYEVPGKWFSFSDNLLDGNSLLCLEPSETKGKYSVGWWSDDLSDENGEFDPGLMITMEFPARPVFFLKMYGDTELGGYPVDFEYKLYGVDDVLLATHTVTANDDPTWRYELIELPSSPGEEVPDPVFDVVKITFEVTKISAPLAQCRIIELFTAYTETYESNELFGISLLEEMDYESGTVPIGNISSNQITVSLHNEDRRFDPSNPESPIRTMMLKHRRIKAWLGVEINEEVGLEWYPLGVFYSMDWSSPDNSPVTTVMGLDRLELLRNSDFAPYEVFADYSLGALAETILTDAGLLEAEYVIDPGLYESDYVVPYAWFNRMTHRYALQKVAENALGFVYCDRYGRIHLERYAPTATVITTFTRDDYYSRDHPLRWNEMVNVVEVAATPRVQSEKKELYSDTEEFVVTAGTQAERFYMFKETPAYGDLTVTLYCVGEGLEYDLTDYPWAARFRWINDTISNISVTGIKIEGYVLEKRGGLIAEARDDISIRQNGRVGLRYPIELEFIQTRAQAQAIADALVLMYADPQKDVMLNARGHIWTQLGDRIGVSNYQDDIAENYAIVRQSIDWTGSLRAQITARKITGGSIFSPAHGGLGYYWE